MISHTSVQLVSAGSACRTKPPLSSPPPPFDSKPLPSALLRAAQAAKATATALLAACSCASSGVRGWCKRRHHTDAFQADSLGFGILIQVYLCLCIPVCRYQHELKVNHRMSLTSAANQQMKTRFIVRATLLSVHVLQILLKSVKLPGLDVFSRFF